MRKRVSNSDWRFPIQLTSELGTKLIEITCPVWLEGDGWKHHKTIEHISITTCRIIHLLLLTSFGNVYKCWCREQCSCPYIVLIPCCLTLVPWPWWGLPPLNYISICRCMCAYQYHIKISLKIWSVSIHMYVCASSVWITTGSDSDGDAYAFWPGLWQGPANVCIFNKTHYAKHNALQINLSTSLLFYYRIEILVYWISFSSF